MDVSMIFVLIKMLLDVDDIVDIRKYLRKKIT